MAVLALVSVNTASFAIDNEPEEGFSTQLFFGLSTSNIKNLEMGLKPGGTAGVKFEYMLPNAHGTYINGGLDWVMKGCKESVDMNFPSIKESVSVTNRICPHYIEVPVHVGFRYNVTDDFGLFGEFGPYFAVGVAGNNKTKVNADGLWTHDYESKYAIFKKDNSRSYFQRWDAGLGFRVGAEYDNHYSLNLGCDWGITDMWRNEYRDIMVEIDNTISKIQNFNFTLTFGYRF